MATKRKLTTIMATGAAVGILVASLPQAAMAGPACRVRNVTQRTSDTSFRRMVERAQDGDRLEVRGICRGGVVISDDLVIKGRGDDATLTGRRRHRVLRIGKDATVKLRGLTIERGTILHRGSVFFTYGGGIVNKGDLTLVRSVVRNNLAYAGAGIFNQRSGRLRLEDTRVSDHLDIQGLGAAILNRGRATLVDSVISGNDADFGGGAIHNEGRMLLRRSTVTDAFASFQQGGGAIHNAADGWLKLVKSRISDAAAGAGGGGIENAGRLIMDRSVISATEAFGSLGGGLLNTGTAILIDSTVEDAKASRGGGIVNKGRLTLVRSTVSGNEAETKGGGVKNSGDLILRDATIAANTAGKSGGGIHNNAERGRVVLRGSSSVTGNVPDDCVGTAAC